MRELLKTKSYKCLSVENVIAHGENNNNNDKVVIVWRNVFLMTVLHLAAIYGIKCVITECQFMTIHFMVLLALSSGFGMLCGSHRLWTHRSYKAKLSLQIFLATLQTMAFQNDIYTWSRDHRVHHKYSETDADPHNAKRGFFFSHVGWLLCEKHIDVKEKGKTVSMSDLERNPVVQFQRKYYLLLVFFIWGVIPTIIPYYFWNENLSSSIYICVFLRYVIVLNITWFVNSAAHMWGNRPYNKRINPAECFIRHLMLGEGFHNFHHTFDWDYSASHFGPSYVYNPTTALIDLFASFGLAYDLKRVSRQSIERKMIISGDINFTKNSRFMELVVGFFSSISYYLVLIALKILYYMYHNENIDMINL